MKHSYQIIAVPLLALMSLTACSDKVKLDEKPDNVEVHTQAMPSGGAIMDQQHGKEVWFAIGAMTGADDINANGVTQAHMFADGSYLHTVSLNIARIEEDGYFYEGWLVNPDTLDLISTGHMTSIMGDARHSLRFTAEEDFSGYTDVVITKEPDDGDPAPAQHVAEGKLKYVER